MFQPRYSLTSHYQRDSASPQSHPLAPCLARALAAPSSFAKVIRRLAGEWAWNMKDNSTAGRKCKKQACTDSDCEQFLLAACLAEVRPGPNFFCTAGWAHAHIPAVRKALKEKQCFLH